MARRKKRLNKKVVVLLALIIGVFLIVGIGLWIIHQPKDPKIYAERAANFVKEGDYRSAVRDYSIAANAAADVDKPKYLVKLADTLLEWHQKDKSLTASTRARLFYTARDKLLEALRYNPKYLDAQRRLTQIEFTIGYAQGDMERCIRAADDLLKLDPSDEETLYRRALAKAQLAKTREVYLTPALEDFTRLVKIAPQKDRYWLGLINLKAKILENDPRKNEQIEQLYKKAIKADPDSADIRIFYARFLERNDRKEEAIKQLLQATKLQPNSAKPYLELASFYNRSGKREDAIAALVKAKKADPQDYRPYWRLARAYTALKHADKAEKIILEGIKTIKAKKKPKPSTIESASYDIGITVLNQALCDVLLDKLEKIDSKEERKKILDRVNNLLAEIKEIAQKSRFSKKLQPYIDKVSGRLALANGKPVEAEKLLRKAYDSFDTFEPKTAEILINLYKRLGQLGEAQQILSRFVLLTKNNPTATLALAKLYISSRAYDRALRLIRRVLREQESDEVLSLKLGLEAVMGRRRQIPASLKKLDPAATSLFLQAARQLWAGGARTSAIRLVQDVLKREPKNLAALLQILQWYKIQKEQDKVKSILAYIERTYKDKPFVIQQVQALLSADRSKLLAAQLALAKKETDPVLRALRIAGIYRSFGDEKKYLEYLSKAEKQDPKNPTVIRWRFEDALRKQDWAKAKKYAALAAEIDIDGVGGKMYKARLAAIRGNIDEALSLARQAVQICPHFSEYHAFLGDCYYAMGKIDKAKSEYETAHSQSPSNISALKGLIRVSERLGNTDDYAHWVTLAYRIAPKDPEVRERYMVLAESQENPEKVIRMREQIRKSQPDNLPNLLQLARLYERTGRFAVAEQLYREVARRSNQSPWAMGVLAEFLYRTHRDVEARQMLASWAEKRASDKATAYAVWGAYLDLAGDVDQAEAVLKKAIKDSPKDPDSYLAMAKFYARHKKWSQAAHYQKRYLTLSGKNATRAAKEDLIAYLINANMLQEAEKVINESLKTAPNDIGMLNYKATVRIGQKKFDEAMQILNRILTIQPDYKPALSTRADLYLMMGEKHKAISDLEAARRAGGSIAVGIKLSKLYDSIGDFSNAQAVLKALLAESPRSPIVLKELIDLYYRHKRWVSLQDILTKAKSMYPQNTYYLVAEANMWRQRNMMNRAIAALEKAHNISPDNHNIALALTEALAMVGQYEKVLKMGAELQKYKDIAPQATALIALAYAKGNRFKQADEMFEQAIRMCQYPSQLLFVYDKVKMAYSSQEAIKKIKQWSKLLPKKADIYHVIGSTLRRAGDISAAEEYLTKALSLAQNDRLKYMIKNELALVYMYSGQYDQCVKVYKDLLKGNPDNAVVLNNLAWTLCAYEQVRDLDEALKYAQKAVQIKPHEPNSLDTYGYILYLKGRFDKAADILKQSVRIRASSTNRLHLGMVYEKMGRTGDAIKQYRLAWEFVKDNPKDPNYNEIRKALERFEKALSGSTTR